MRPTFGFIVRQTSMTLDQIAIVGQIVAAVGVIGSLIFVGLQVRQSNQVMRDSAIRHHAERIQSISRALFDSPDLAGIWLKGGDDLDKLSSEERWCGSLTSTFTSCGCGSSFICKKRWR